MKTINGMHGVIIGLDVQGEKEYNIGRKFTIIDFNGKTMSAKVGDPGTRYMIRVYPGSCVHVYDREALKFYFEEDN